MCNHFRSKFFCNSKVNSFLFYAYMAEMMFKMTISTTAYLGYLPSLQNDLSMPENRTVSLTILSILQYSHIDMTQFIFLYSSQQVLPQNWNILPCNQGEKQNKKRSPIQKRTCHRVLLSKKCKFTHFHLKDIKKSPQNPTRRTCQDLSLIKTTGCHLQSCQSVVCSEMKIHSCH